MSSTPMGILVVGGTGALGTSTCAALTAMGQNVTATYRDEGRAAVLRDMGVTLLPPADVTDIVSLRRAFGELKNRPAGVIINAGILKGRGPQDFWNVNARGPGNVLNALQKTNRWPKSLTLVSSQLVGGPDAHSSSPIDRYTPGAPNETDRSDYARSKAAGEHYANRAWGNGKGFVSLRPAGILSPGDTITTEPMVTGLRGFLGLVGIYPNLTSGDDPQISVISARNMGEVLAHVAVKNATELLSGIYDVTNGQDPLTIPDIIAAGKIAFGTHWILTPHLPWLLSAVAFVEEQRRKYLGAATVVDASRVQELTNPWLASSNDRLYATFPELRGKQFESFEQIMLQCDFARQMPKNTRFNRWKYSLARSLGLVT